MPGGRPTDYDISYEAILDVISNYLLSSTPMLLIVEISYQNLGGLRVISEANKELNHQGYYFHPKVRESFSRDEWGVYSYSSDGIHQVYHTYGA